MPTVATGLDVLREDYWSNLKGSRLGYLSNPASLDRGLRSGKKILADLLPGHLKALFGPQHGHGGEDQDNMIETPHATDPELKIPVYSLYSGTREPTQEMLDRLDILIIDLQDVGTRVYTFASTMLNCLKAAAGFNKRILVLDRPNPLGGVIVEGNLLKEELYSFVGPYALPMRHGMTMGEMARMFNKVFKLGCELEIVPMKGWRRHMLWKDTGLRWLMPSPNMPLPETAQVYPGQVLWEGTNLSEGRGTCRPFELFGAPYLDTRAVLEKTEGPFLEGCHLQEMSFRPTFHKWQGQICHGFMIHVLDPTTFRPYLLSLALLQAVLFTHEDQFEWKSPPYEYDYDRMPIDLILGDSRLRGKIEKGEDLSSMQMEWKEELESFLAEREAFLLYH
ncbi:MAG: DUF1343 domain-containing protein [Deltaproteobacteria bacterium]|nr:DUF1343 domain-containing protein [Deltaproteobacteria bacterium]MBW2017155.1 DUF1343 domain-containing protein [Deltaproteobacteria bacterium]